MNEVLQVKSLTKRVKQKVILQDVSLSVSEGEILGLIGPNGAGKTTLLKIVSGVVRATSGSVLFDKSAGIVLCLSKRITRRYECLAESSYVIFHKRQNWHK